MYGNRDSHTLMADSRSLKNSLALSSKAEVVHRYDPVIPFLGYTQETLLHVCNRKSVHSIFGLTPNWKKCAMSISRRMNKRSEVQSYIYIQIQATCNNMNESDKPNVEH